MYVCEPRFSLSSAKRTYRNRLNAKADIRIHLPFVKFDIQELQKYKTTPHFLLECFLK